MDNHGSDEKDVFDPFSFLSQQNNNLVDKNTKLAYRYSKVGFDAEEKYSLLLRSAGHGIDQEGKHVSLSVKCEYIPEAGSQTIEDEELLWDWLTAILKGSTEHLNMHIYPRNGHCLQIRRFDPKRIFSDFPQRLKQLFVFQLYNNFSLDFILFN